MDLQIIQAVIVAAVSSSGLSSLIIFLIQRRDRKKEEKAAKNSATNRLIIGLGHDRMVFLTDKYVRRGGITLKEKRNLKYLYEPYADNGGNGDCEIGWKACLDLPVISEDTAEKMDAEIKRKEYGLDPTSN